jgi:hypothetical protein
MKLRDLRHRFTAWRLLRQADALMRRAHRRRWWRGRLS